MSVDVGLKKKLSIFVCITIILSGAVPGFAGVWQKQVFVIGDSTASTYDETVAPRMGWGQVLQRFFKKRVTVHNQAVSGRSSKSFWDEGLFDAFLDEINKGDYLLIQFGHNDEKSQDPLRYTEPYTTYKEYLSLYIDECRSRGCIPVLLTPVNRRKWNDDGTLKMTHGEYPAAMLELGREKNVPVIDITEKSRVLFEELGIEGTKDIFLHLAPGESKNYPDGVEDNSHFKEEGAMAVAQLVVDGIWEMHLRLARFLLN